jgi:ribonuclease III
MGSGYIEDYLTRNGLIDSVEIQDALTHKSADSRHYEKLEFLGDSVLGLIISEYLYAWFNDVDVGVMAKMKGYLVSRDALFVIGKKNNIVKLLKSGSALSRKEIKDNKKIISDIIESIIGAVYLVKGLEAAREFILTIYRDEFKEAKGKKDYGDYKSELQIRLLALYNILPVYTVVKTEGKEHKKTFYVEASAQGRLIGKGKGRTIKEAEQSAARRGMEKISKEEKK